MAEGQSTGDRAVALEALLARHAPPSAYRPHFANRVEAARFFAGAQEKRYGLASARGPCGRCGREPAPMRVSYRFRAVMHAGFRFAWWRLLGLLAGQVTIPLSERAAEVSFLTHHPLCSTCRDRMWWNRFFGSVLKAAGTLASVLGAIGMAIGYGSLLVAWRPYERTRCLGFALIASAILLAGIACLVPVRRLRLPPGLRYLARQPFTYHSARFSRLPYDG